MIKSRFFILICGALLSFLYSCRPMVSGDKLMAYMSDPDNGLFLVRRSDRVSIMVQYLPPSYQVWQDIQSGAEYTSSQVDSAQKAYAEFCYFRMIIRGADSVRDKLYLDFGIKNELFMVLKNDTIPCLMCQHIMNGNSNSQEYLLAFPGNADTGGRRKFKYNDVFLFTAKTLGLAPQAFEFTRSNLNKIPGLKI